MNLKTGWVAAVFPGIALIAYLGFRSLDHEQDYAHIDGRIFGTHYRVTYLKGPGVDAVHPAIEAELQRIDQMASTWKDDSELMRYQRSPDPDAFALSPDLAWLLRRSDQLKEETGGAFDIRYQPGQIDLSAIAKGFAVDCIVARLTEDLGITSCLVDIGGEIKVHGPGPKGEKWKLGVYLPGSGDRPQQPEFHLRDTSIATSGTTFKHDHLINPEHGKPAKTGLLCVSVIHPSSTTADALATALYVMGSEKGMAWARENRVHAIFFKTDGQVLENVREPSIAP